MKYTIDVSGKGGEAFIFKLSKEQYEFLQDSGVEDDLMEHDDIYKTLKIEDYMDTDHIVSGLYNGSEYIMITVTDESGDVVWQSDSDFEFEEIEDIYQYNDDNYLLVEDYQKGNFFIYTLETDEDFNPDLLSAKVVELLDGRSELITDLKYNGEEMLKDYGDTGSKGFTYMLS